MTRGVIYSAVGTKYISEAVNSARSSLRFNHIPHVLFCDPEPPGLAEIEFRRIYSSGDPFEDKINAIRSTPFSETLFLDCDTYVVSNLDGVFDLLQKFDIALAQEASYTTNGDQTPADAFVEFNSGVIAYRTSQEVSDMLDIWLELYRLWRRSPPVPFARGPEDGDQEYHFRRGAVEQHALRRTLWERRVSLYVLGPEYNFRAAYPSRLCGRLRIIHGRVNFEAVARTAETKLGPRVFRPG